MSAPDDLKRAILGERTPEELTAAAWKAIAEFTSQGKITLPSGRVLIPDKDDPSCKYALDIFKWLAQVQGKPKKVARAMDNWKPPVTGG